MVDHDSGQLGMPAPEARRALEQSRRAGGPGRAPGTRGLPRWHPRNWRMRWRIIGLVVIPTLAALTLGTLRIQAAQDTSAAAARVGQLGVLGGDITSLAESMEDERDLTAGYVATRLAGMNPMSTQIAGRLQRQYAVTSARLATVQNLAGQIGPAFPAVARNDLSSVLTSLPALTELRALTHTQMEPLPLITHYSSVIATLLEFDNDIGAGSSDAQLAQTVTSVAALAQVEEQASQQRAILYADLLTGTFALDDRSALSSAQSSEASELAVFQKEATNLPAFIPGSGLSSAISLTEQYSNTVAGPQIFAAAAIENDAITSGNPNELGIASAPEAWFADMTFKLNAYRTVESDEISSVAAQAGALQRGAANSRQLTAIAVLVLLILVLLAAVILARSLIIPLRRLRADALDVAGRRLPDIVRRLSDAGGAEQNLKVEPIGISSTDEIGEVARAFDQVHSEAVRLAGDEAMLRANLNAMFVNLSRRSQSLIERQLGIIDTLEQSEQDPDRLSSLFRLDHLATRMRRNSENLLVLAGHEATRKWTQPVPLVDVLRAAISEIEQYERITLNVQPGIVIVGRAASDVVHLAAELLENAATFSPEETQVLVTGQMVTSGGVLIEITDEGLGIQDEDLDYANWRLDNPPVVDVGVSRRMGLFVVGRLAARHGIRVRLRRAQRGLSALIWLPETVAEPEPTAPLGMSRRRFGTDGYPVHHATSTGPMPAVPLAGTRASRVQSSAFTRSARAPFQPASAPTPALAVPAVPIRRPAAQAQPTEPAPATTPPSGPNPWLPIYAAVESDWFRRSGKSIETPGQSAASSWASPADEGFRAAARAAASPTTGTTTTAGLPRRVPKANLVPGSVSEPGGGEPAGPQPVIHHEGQAEAVPAGRPGPAQPRRRAPDEVRARLADFQRGARQGRSDAPWDFGADEN